jgi:Immunity protein 35
MGINLVEAMRIVNNKLDLLKAEIGADMVVIENATIEKNLYWVFFYNSKAYLEEGNLSSALAGNSPLIVDKIDGSIHQTGTAHSIEFYLEEFERTKK